MGDNSPVLYTYVFSYDYLYSKWPLLIKLIIQLCYNLYIKKAILIWSNGHCMTITLHSKILDFSETSLFN